MFTRDQIEEIKKKLVAFGTKDTQLLDAHKLDGNEIVAIVQDGENRKIPLSSIIGLLSDISVTPNDDFINVSKDTTGFLTLSTAVSKVDINNRKLGQVITFKDSANSWAVRQFTGSSLDNWHDISLWKSISGIDELKSQVESNAEDISVLSGEIDRHDASILNLSTDVSKLKDKDTETSSSLSGLTTRVDTLKSQADTNTNNISSLNTEVSTLQSKVDVNTTSISKNKVAIEKNTSDIKNVSDTVDAQAAKLNDVDTTLENALFKNKGYFTTLEKLNEAIPSPTIGSKAYVGTSEPYAIYIVENGVWVDSGYTGGDEIVAKITTDRIENGAVTSEKIATSAFDDTLSVSGKIAPADVVGGKFTELDKEINGDKGKIIKHLNSLTFGGVNGYCAFDDVILSQDGDELAIELQTDSFATIQKAWSFATYDFTRISLALMSYLLGAKDASNNWLSDMNASSGQMNLPQDARFSQRNILRIRYSDGKMQFIVGEQIVKEFTEQKTISFNRLGKYTNSSTTDYFWKGTIYAFDYTHNGTTKSIVDMNLVTDGDTIADITEEQEGNSDGLVKRVEKLNLTVDSIKGDVQVIKEDMPSVNITEEEKSVQIPLTSFMKKENYYIGSTSGGTLTGNNTFYFIADKDLSIYLKSEFAQGKTYRIGVGSGTITAYQWRKYASAYPTPSGQAPTLDTPWNVIKGELFAITVALESQFDVENLVVEKKKYLTDSHIKQYEENFEDIYSKIGGDSEDKLVIQSVSPTEFNVISVANRKILRYNFKRRRYTRNFGGSEVLCGDVWNNEMIFNKDKEIIQGNTNFIIAIDGEESGFADESKDFAAGPGHGCEIAEWTKFIADGMEFDPTNIGEDIECKELRFVLSSNVYAVDSTLSRANNTGNENNYPRVVDGQMLKSAHHYMDVSFSAGNKIEVRNRLTVLRDNTIFRGCYAGMLQCYPIAFNEVSINDATSSLESFTSSQNHLIVSGDGVIGWSPKKAHAETFYGDGIIVSQYMESLNADRYDKLNLFTPPSYADRVKTYFQPCRTSVVGDYETFNNGYTFDIKIVRMIHL